MGFTKSTENLSIIQALDDEPNDVGGLTAAQLKAEFDEAGNTLQVFVNGLIDQLEAKTAAGDLGAVALDGAGKTSVQAVLIALKALVDACETKAAAESALALKADKAVTAGHFKAVGFNSRDGKFTFTKENGAEVVIDTALEKVATNWAYDGDSQSLVLTLADGSSQRVSLSDFITETEFLDSGEIEFSVSGHRVTARLKSGSITEAMLSSTLLAAIQGYVEAAAESAQTASAQAALAGQSKNAAQEAASAAQSHKGAAEVSAAAASSSASAAAEAEENAELSETAAAGSAEAAEASAGDAEAWATGKRGGTAVSDTDPAYHNNALYYKEQATQAAGGGVLSFKERNGAVLPQAGDYTPEMVGADPSGAAAAVQAGLDGHTGDKSNPHGVTLTQIGAAAAHHTHSAGDIRSGVLLIGRGGTGATEAAAARENLGAAATVTYTANVSTTWTEDATNGGYTQTIALSGILATDNPIADVVLGSDVDANAAYVSAWALVSRITTAANSITLYANGNAPETAFTMQLKAVR